MLSPPLVVQLRPRQSPQEQLLESLRVHKILTPTRQGLRQVHQTEPLVVCRNRTNGTEGMIRGLLDAIKTDRRSVIEEPTLPEEEEVEMTLVGATGLTVKMTTKITRKMLAAILPIRTPPGEEAPDPEAQRYLEPVDEEDLRGTKVSQTFPCTEVPRTR